MSDTDVIVIECESEEEVAADRADLSVLIHGSSVVTGQAVLRQAAEVASFVERLRELGVEEKAVSVKSVSAEVSRGIFTKSSSATYVLSVRCTDLALLPDLLATLPKLKDVGLLGVKWAMTVWPRPGSSVKKCLAMANEKAAIVAEGLHTTLLGVHRYREQFIDTEALPEETFGMAAEAGAVEGIVRPSASERGAVGLTLSHTKKVKLCVIVEYRVGSDRPA